MLIKEGMAMEKKAARKKVIEIEEKTARMTSKDRAEEPTINTSTVTATTKTTTTIRGKRSRNTDKEQEPNNYGEKQRTNKHGGKQEPIKKRLAVYGNYDHYYGYRVFFYIALAFYCISLSVT